MFPVATKAAALAAVLALVALLSAFVYRRWLRGALASLDDPEGASDDWHEHTRALAAEVRGAAAALDGVSHDRAQRRLVPLASRLRRQVRVAPADVDDAVLIETNALATDCQALGMEYSRSEAIRSGVFLDDRLAVIEREAAALEETVAAASRPTEAAPAARSARASRGSRHGTGPR